MRQGLPTHLIALALALAALSARAEESRLPDQFQEVGLKLVQDLGKVLSASELAELSRAIKETQIVPADQACLDRDPSLNCPDEQKRDAVNWPARKLIYVTRDRWVSIYADKRDARRLVLHEYFGICGLEKNIFTASLRALEQLEALDKGPITTRPFCAGRSLEEMRNEPLYAVPVGTLIRFMKPVAFDHLNYMSYFVDGARASRLKNPNATAIWISAPDRLVLNQGPIPRGTVIKIARNESSAYSAFLMIWQSGINAFGGKAEYDPLSPTPLMTVGYFLDHLRGVIEGCIPNELKPPLETEYDKPPQTSGTDVLTDQILHDAEAVLKREINEGDRRLEERFCVRHELETKIQNRLLTDPTRKGWIVYGIAATANPAFGVIDYDVLGRKGNRFAGTMWIQCKLR